MNARTLGPVFGFGLALATAAACADPSVDHPMIIVTVVQGQIHVSKETADILPTEGGVVWKLPANSGYEFPDTGIVVASPQDVHKCVVTHQGQGFRCAKLKHVSAAKYKYTVNLIVSGSGQAPPPLDPFILHHDTRAP
jgi:hypothetical protein